MKSLAGSSCLAKLYEVIRDHLGLNVSRIHPRVSRKIFLESACVRHCDGSCCRSGTTVSVDERDRILDRAGMVGACMTSRARHDPSGWFDGNLEKDDDFTAGCSTTTRVLDGACVFYRDDGRCALQVAGEKHLSTPFALKPAVCLLWPLAVQKGSLEVGYAWYTRRRECCAPVVRGTRTILEVISPDENLIRTMSNPGISRGGGPPPPSLPSDSDTEQRLDLRGEDRHEVHIPARVDRVDHAVRLQEHESRR